MAIQPIEEFVPTLEDSRRELAVKIAQEILDKYTSLCQEHGTSAATKQNDEKPLGARHLAWMCEQVIENGETWPSSRLHRWVGFIQAGLMGWHILTLDEEMDRVRNLKQLHPEE